ncbi:MAG: hypothetical protein O2794_03390, partial [bacterium]|nr:hypothetical protein [bacterium]
RLKVKKGVWTANAHAVDPLILDPGDLPPFEREQGCQLLPKKAPKPSEICVPVSKDPSQDPTGHEIGTIFTCYKMKCPSEDNVTVSLADQFGDGSLEVNQKTTARRLCVPNTLSKPVPTPTPTPVPTPTPDPTPTPGKLKLVMVKFVGKLHGPGDNNCEGPGQGLVLEGPVVIKRGDEQTAPTGERTVQTEILSMDLRGISPILGQVRLGEALGGSDPQDPDDPPCDPRLGPGCSGGQTVLTDLGDGTFNVDSFFDVWTELSVEGGPACAPVLPAGFFGTDIREVDSFFDVFTEVRLASGQCTPVINPADLSGAPVAHIAHEGLTFK